MNYVRPREFENNLKLTLYKEVKEAIGQKDTTMQNATLLVVNEMLEEDSVFREKLINILLQSTNSKKLIETQQKLNEFQEGQTTIKSDKLTIDVFYLEDILEEAELRAETVCSVLRSKYPHPKYIIRKRLLPKSINAKIEYRIDFNQIRYNFEEKQIATEIFKEIRNNKIFNREQPKLVQINNKTYNYVSIFVRNM